MSTLPGDETQTCILTEEGIYTPYKYENESDLERLVVKNSKDVFGDHSVYVDVKQKIASKVKARITDGLVLDLTNASSPKLSLVEYELSGHDMYRVVEPQLRGFLRAIRNEDTLARILETVYDEVRRSPDKMRLVREIFGKDSDVHYEIDRLLHREVGIIVIIDSRTDQLDEILDEIVNMGKEVKVIEFRTYIRDGKKIHTFTRLSELEPAKGEVGGATPRRLWAERLAWTLPENRTTVDMLTNRVVEMLPGIVHNQRYRWYSFFVSQPAKTPNEFLVLLLGKKSLTAAIRTDPEHFSDPKKLTSPVVHWFFPRGTERRLKVTLENMNDALDLIKQSYEVMLTRKKSVDV